MSFVSLSCSRWVALYTNDLLQIFPGMCFILLVCLGQYQSIVGCQRERQRRVLFSGGHDPPECALGRACPLDSHSSPPARAREEAGSLPNLVSGRRRFTGKCDRNAAKFPRSDIVHIFWSKICGVSFRSTEYNHLMAFRCTNLYSLIFRDR